MDHHEKRHLLQMSFFVVIVGENFADYPEFVRASNVDKARFFLFLRCE